MNLTESNIVCGDNLSVMNAMEPASVDLVMTSPPYEAQRTYGVGFKLKGQEFVDWCTERFLACLRVSRGLVAWVIEGATKQFRWSASPVLLMADLHRHGVHLRKPPAFHRVGIPGSGGPDWLRNDYEFIVCATNGGKLPWSANTAMGHPPLWAPGGAMSNRHSDGKRKNARGYSGKNQWGHSIKSGATVVDAGGVVRSRGQRPSHVDTDILPMEAGGVDLEVKKRFITKQKDGMHGGQGNTPYGEPTMANPGNAIQKTYTASEVVALLMEASDFQHHNVGGGVMGSKLAHENEAPYPESLAEFFVRSFCPPGGIVLDPFCGSGTTPAVAVKCGRIGIGIDIRESQVELSNRRLEEAANKRSLLV